jgi:hypothetical protein
MHMHQDKPEELRPCSYPYTRICVVFIIVTLASRSSVSDSTYRRPGVERVYVACMLRFILTALLRQPIEGLEIIHHIITYKRKIQIFFSVLAADY